MSNRSGEADLLEEQQPKSKTEPKLRPVETPEFHSVESESVRTASYRHGEPELPNGFIVDESSVEALLPRIAKLERRARIQMLALVVAVAIVAALLVDRFILEDVIVKQTLMESKELTLVDNDGNARLFIRMYSKVPVLQIMDGNGKPRMSLGLRFDDTPFIDLSDKRGRTRATFEMTEDDSPSLRLFDENGNPTFNIN